ncbi:carboxylesterase/lipase family protein [Proteobacteria bacterium 005FR1]|nr:carboxylesterase/lipase family protein [Proteobacteria bacterium 005FR1]
MSRYPGITRRRLLRHTAIGGLALGLPLPLFAQGKTSVVETSAGKLRGADVQGIKSFKGIRYGEPPTGAGRFKAARPAAGWSGVREALDYGHCSPQGRSMEPERPRSTGFSLQGENATFSEDCLYLNVWTPGLDSGKRPVMVWLHGGGFSTGSGGSILYEGSNLARTQDVVVVTLNHRLNAFGFLDLSEIAGEEYADSSTAGMTDIVLALQWVQKNIERFGGDPGRVTIFGESGGGRKVSVLMAMPAAQGLFHRAIVQSGSQLRTDSQAVGTHRAKLFMEALGLKPNEADKLKDIPPGKLLGAMNRASAVMDQFRPTAGAPSLPRHPFDPGAPAISAGVPMMIGSNLTETSFFMSRDPRVLTLDAAGVVERVKNMVPAGKAGEVFAAYQRFYPGMEPSDILFRIATDRGYFLDSTIQGARKAEQKGAPAFVYSFEWEQPLTENRTHVPHGSEIAFAFYNLDLARGDNPEPLAAVMSEAWAEFARSGNPSTEALGAWTPYNPDNRPTMVFSEKSGMVNDPRGEQRKLMLSFGSQQEREPELKPLN